jgi:hypothetical protein
MLSAPDLVPEVSVDIDALIPADAPRTMHDFVRYWASRRSDGPLPAYGDIDPVDIPWALARTYILEVRPDGDFVYRLAGEIIAQRYDRSLKGARISDLFSDRSVDSILQRWHRVAAGPSAYYSHTQHTSLRGPAVTARRVLLPLGKNGRTADHIIGFTAFDEDNDSLEQFANGLVTTAVRWCDLSGR